MESILFYDINWAIKDLDKEVLLHLFLIYMYVARFIQHGYCIVYHSLQGHEHEFVIWAFWLAYNFYIENEYIMNKSQIESWTTRDNSIIRNNDM